jgi:hypothetical protein
MAVSALLASRIQFAKLDKTIGRGVQIRSDCEVKLRAST